MKKVIGEKLKTSKRWRFGLGFIGFIFVIVIATSIYGFSKPLPAGVSYEGETHTVADIEFLHDITYEENGERHQEQMIFDRMFELINEAEDFVVLDMFLFNKQYDQSMDFPPLSKQLVDTLVEKKENDDIEIIVITDRINTFYGSYSTDILTTLEEHDIPVLFSNMKPLRDSNPVYSGFYRTFIQWIGTEGRGWLPNAFSPDAPDVTLRSYLELVNFKANHRKTLITERDGLVTSGNAHDASSYHSNIGFVFQGDILDEMLETEKTVAEMAGADENMFSSLETKSTPSSVDGDYDIQLLTEGKIKKHVLQAMNQTKQGETITLGAFYLSDRDVIAALIRASERGAEVNVLLDANKDAFGREKNGIPNRPVAHELVSKTDGDINVRWYRTDGEQFHTKMVFMEQEEQDVLIGGSSNFTKRNMGDFNLETDVKITASSETEVMTEVDQYFERLWTNENHVYTQDFETYVDDSHFSYLLYRFQEWSGISSF